MSKITLVRDDRGEFVARGGGYYGDYYTAADVKRLLTALKSYIGKFGNCGDVYDEAQAAIKQAEEDA